jgi:hypothetical protein
MFGACALFGLRRGVGVVIALCRRVLGRIRRLLRERGNGEGEQTGNDESE